MLLTLVTVSSTGWATTYNLSSVIKQRNEPVGQAYNFVLTLHEFNAVPSDVTLEIISPSGTRFGESTVPGLENNIWVDIEGIHPDDLNREYSGMWTIEETPVDGPLNRYEFTIPEVLTKNSFLDAPVITLPKDGATEGAVFDVSWTNFIPGNCHFEYSAHYPGGFYRPDIQCDGNGSAVFSYLDPAFAGVEMTDFSVNVQRIQPGELLPVVPVTPLADASFTGGWLTRQSNSPEINFSVVPEPTAMVMLLSWISLTSIFGRRIRLPAQLRGAGMARSTGLVTRHSTYSTHAPIRSSTV
jgi:hypothetical protein